MEIFVEMGWSFQGIFKTERDGDSCEKDWVKDVKAKKGKIHGCTKWLSLLNNNIPQYTLIFGYSAPLFFMT